MNKSLTLPRLVVLVLVAGLLLTWLVIRLGNERSTPTSLCGPLQKELSDCPNSPNCVSTSASRTANNVNPIVLRTVSSGARAQLEDIIEELPGSKIVLSNDRYFHVEFRSRLFGFVDDLELLIDEDQKLIFVRSASRVGYSDLGANRKRVQEIRRRYEAL